ncbi:lasso peptide biosynthesis protein [Streptomyces sp. NPDC050546]|uniref:lasso peptide biosynthesis protein n=1 Tax=Streptomyces sp. NPDC050546 TaxID=3365628 RepID=UPI00378776C7
MSPAPSALRPAAGSPRETPRELRRRLVRSALAGVRVPAEVPVRGRELPRAVADYLRVGRAFRTGGLAAALPLLPAVDPGRPRRALRDEATAFCARAAAWQIQGLARTVAGAHLCLHESLGVCAALRGLGFDAEVVIGYPVIEHSDGSEELHAWPALGDLPLVGRGGERPLGYVELLRYPQEA